MPSAPSSSARVANLLRLVHAVSHDLSNPMQGLMLHATMGLEDAEPGSDAALRHQTDVEATRRMRTLLRALQGLAVAGDRPRTIDSVLQRFSDIFADRWARMGVPLEVAPLPAGATEVPPLLEETLLAVGLATSERVRTRPTGLDAVKLVARPSDGPSGRLAIELLGTGAAAVATEIAGDIAPLDGSIDVVADGASIVLRAAPGGGA